MPKKAGSGKKSSRLDWKRKRRPEYMEMKQYRYYIFCEGQQTEPKYFEGFKKLIEYGNPTPDSAYLGGAEHIHAGGEPLESALRELEEELGIKAEPDELTYVNRFVIQYEKEFYGKMFRDSEIAFVYAYTKPVTLEELTLQEEELDGAEWFNLNEVIQECEKHNQKFCAPFDGLRIIRNFT